MFKEVQYVKMVAPYSHCWKIVDDDFEEEVVAGPGGWATTAITESIIDVYTKRHLPVAKNLIRYMLQTRNNNGWSLDQQVELNKRFNYRWPEVEKDLQIYLLFS